MSHVKEELLDKFVTMFGLPKTDNVEAYLAEYQDALVMYSADTLADAAKIIIRSQEHKTWPTVGVCVKACRKALDDCRRTTPRPAPAPDNDDYQAPSDEAKARVQQMVDDLKFKMSA